MSPLERARALALGQCRFSPATFSKRFAKDMMAQARAEEPTITERQAFRLTVQVYIYRRQVERIAGQMLVRGEIEKATALEVVPTQPPPGYETPKQRFDRACLEEHRRRTHLPPVPPLGAPIEEPGPDPAQPELFTR